MTDSAKDSFFFFFFHEYYVHLFLLLRDKTILLKFVFIKISIVILIIKNIYIEDTMLNFYRNDSKKYEYF